MNNLQSRTVEPLRSAVSSGAYPEAERLLGGFRAEMQARWMAASSAEERAAIRAEVGDLLAWARTASLAGRSHVQRKLIHLTCKKAYTALAISAESVGDPTPTVQFATDRAATFPFESAS